MKVTEELVNRMYQYSGVSREKVLEVLKGLDPKKYLEKPYNTKWKKDNPLYGYSYYLSEFLYYYIAPPGSICKRIYFAQGKKGTLQQYIYFVQWPDTTVVDLTLAQHTDVPNYGGAKEASLKPRIQPTTKAIAEKLGYSDEDLDL